MALLPEHDTYLTNMTTAFEQWRDALAAALEQQDNPSTATLGSFQSAKSALDTKRAILKGYIDGVGVPTDPPFPAPPLQDDLKIYASPGSGTSPVMVGQLVTQSANLPGVL